MPEPRLLPVSTAHVWTISLDRPSAGDLDLLDNGERARASRFRRDFDRDRYVAAHAALRRILATYLAIAATDLRFIARSGGKPECIQAPWLCFNLSHAGSWALLAVARNREVGVDVEAVRSGSPDAALVEHVCTPAEHAWLDALPASQRAHGFLRLWTAKEAYLKARGVGLEVEPQTIDLRIAGEEFVLPPMPAGAVRDWHLYPIEVPAGVVAALVVEGRVDVEQFEYPFDTVRRE